MDIIENIRNYKRIFTRFSNNYNNNFAKYLNDKKMNVIEFLISVGLNPKLVQSFTYDEIESLANHVLELKKFPVVSYPPHGEDLEHDCLSLYNPEKGIDLVITSNSLEFNDSFNDEKEESFTNHVIITSYRLIEGNICKKVIKTSTIHNYDEKTIATPNKCINGMAIEATETIYDNEGKVINEGSYNVNINCSLSSYAYSTIYRPLMFDSIINGIYNIVELIAQGKLKREDIDINLNITNLQKK